MGGEGGRVKEEEWEGERRGKRRDKGRGNGREKVKKGRKNTIQ